MAPDLRVNLGRLRLPNPVLAAAGTFGYGLEFLRVVPLERLGGLVTKTITLEPRAGNPPPRLADTPSGMLNAVGLQNVGLARFIDEKLPALARMPLPVIVSVLAESPEEMRALCSRLDREPAVAAIEMNLSCPNIKWKGEAPVSFARECVSACTEDPSTRRRADAPTRAPLDLAGCAPTRQIAQDPDQTREMVRTAREATSKPLIAKLSPDVTDLRPVAQAAERAGADALALANTFTGMSLDPATRRSRIGMLTGGLSGPAIRPLAVYRVWYTAAAVRIPIIGLGGITRGEHAVEFILAGATAVAVGTATFADPRAAVRVADGLARYLSRHGLRAPEELRGAVVTDG